MFGKKRKDPREIEPLPGPKGDGRWIVLADGTRERHVCDLPRHDRLGSVFQCSGCHQIWKYTHDNIASCFWVHAGWLKRLAYNYVKGN